MFPKRTDHSRKSLDHRQAGDSATRRPHRSSSRKRRCMGPSRAFGMAQRWARFDLGQSDFLWFSRTCPGIETYATQVSLSWWFGLVVWFGGLDWWFGLVVWIRIGSPGFCSGEMGNPSILPPNHQSTTNLRDADHAFVKTLYCVRKDTWFRRESACPWK